VNVDAGAEISQAEAQKAPAGLRGGDCFSGYHLSIARTLSAKPLFRSSLICSSFNSLNSPHLLGYSPIRAPCFWSVLIDH
jgi:hypothetical protein